MHAINAVKINTDDGTLEDRSTLTPGQVTMLLGVCLKTTYFIYHQQFYEQAEGAAMGSPVSPVVANIFMEFVEEVAINTSPSPLRFVRDMLMILFVSCRRQPLMKSYNISTPSLQPSSSQWNKRRMVDYPSWMPWCSGRKMVV